MLLRLASLALPVLYLAFLLADRQGVWSHLRGLDSVEAVTARFEKSYAPDASAPVSVGDPEWKPLINLIYKYSNADFPKDKKPQTVARLKATLSGEQLSPDGKLQSEWTAPSTPFMVLYRRWPGNAIPKEDWRIGGTIGDLRSWILRSKEDLRFLVKDVFLVLFSFIVGLLLFFHEHRAIIKTIPAVAAPGSTTAVSVSNVNADSHVIEQQAVKAGVSSVSKKTGV
jgi:hypothetical protein